MNIFFILIFETLSFISMAAGAGEPIELPPVVLTVGEHRVLPALNLKRFTLSRSIVKAVPLPHLDTNHRIALKAIAPGNAQLWVLNQDGSSSVRTIEIRTPLLHQLSDPLTQALSSLSETEVIRGYKKVILRGAVNSPRELRLIQALVDEFPDKISNETSPSQNLVKASLNSIRKLLEEYRVDAHVKQTGDTIELSENAFPAKSLNVLKEKIKSIFPPVRFMNSLDDSSQNTIHFRTYLLEISETGFQELGLEWSSESETESRLGVYPIGPLSKLGFKIKALESTGKAKLLSQPELVVRVPGQAELFAGGEIPIKTSGRYFNQTNWKKFGLTLRLDVKTLIQNNVRLDVTAEVSDLDEKIGSDEIPGFHTNRLTTQVDAKLDRPMLLSGLIKRSFRDAVMGHPFLASLPFIGQLFGTQSTLNKRSELVAILLPSTHAPSLMLERVKSMLPRGPIPPPRNWRTEKEIDQLKLQANWPWNLFEENHE